MNNNKYLLGLDIGSSSIKAALVDIDTGKAVTTAQSPDIELPINSPQAGWAEQDPESWWFHSKEAIKKLGLGTSGLKNIQAIGISYQMHGLVLLDKDKKVLRPSIIWCDSRAVGNGDKAFSSIGEEKCLSHLLNSPGNFTASKLSWVKENEMEIYSQAKHAMLPGDYIAFRLSGEINTTISGLSEGIFWDFKNHKISDDLMENYKLPKDLIPDLVPSKTRPCI